MLNCMLASAVASAVAATMVARPTVAVTNVFL